LGKGEGGEPANGGVGKSLKRDAWRQDGIADEEKSEVSKERKNARRELDVESVTWNCPKRTTGVAKLEGLHKGFRSERLTLNRRGDPPAVKRDPRENGENCLYEFEGGFPRRGIEGGSLQENRGVKACEGDLSHTGGSPRTIRGGEPDEKSTFRKL